MSVSVGVERFGYRLGMQEQGARDYFKRRAEEERLAAQRSTNVRAAEAHRQLAEHYGDLASGVEQVPGEEAEAQGGTLPKDCQIRP